MFEKIFANKKVWIPVAAVVVLVLALVIGALVSKNAGENKKPGTGDNNISTDKDKNDKPNEEGLTEVAPDDKNEETQEPVVEDSVTTPDSWGDDESKDDGKDNGKGDGKDDGKGDGKDDNKGMDTGDVPKDDTNIEWGSVF